MKKALATAAALAAFLYIYFTLPLRVSKSKYSRDSYKVLADSQIFFLNDDRDRDREYGDRDNALA